MYRVWAMVFNFNHISVMWWRSVSQVDETWSSEDIQTNTHTRTTLGTQTKSGPLFNFFSGIKCCWSGSPIHPLFLCSFYMLCCTCSRAQYSWNTISLKYDANIFIFPLVVLFLLPV
jgi:hypothetical protein